VAETNKVVEETKNINVKAPVQQTFGQVGCGFGTGLWGGCGGLGMLGGLGRLFGLRGLGWGMGGYYY
jgi:hypothetical protein